MSELKVDKVSPRTGKYVALNTVGMKNIIINGDMSLAQRATSVASITTGGYKTVDRMDLGINGLGTWTQSQSTDVPTEQGFATSLKMDCTTANASPAATGQLRIVTRFEGQNLQYLKKGTASALSLTLSFWVKSTKTGTFIAEIFDIDNNRHISKSYTVDVTDTWEKKIITFEGDTTGAFDNDNGNSLQLSFWLGAGTNFTSGTLQTTWGTEVTANRAVGQVNIADSTSNDWYITGVQLEAGTTASDFEFLPVDVNLGRCLRYYYVHINGSSQHLSLGAMYSSTYLVAEIRFPVEMRSVPSLVQTTGTDYYRFYRNGTSDYFDNWSQGIARATKNSTNLETAEDISGTAGHAGIVASNSISAIIALNAEL
jgi:hypothetical protein